PSESAEPVEEEEGAGPLLETIHERVERAHVLGREFVAHPPGLTQGKPAGDLASSASSAYIRFSSVCSASSSLMRLSSETQAPAYCDRHGPLSGAMRAGTKAE